MKSPALKSNATHAAVEPGPRRDAALPVMIVVGALLLGAGAAPDALAKLCDRFLHRDQARLHVEHSSHNWGRVFVGQVVRHTYCIENRGGQPLELRYGPMG